MRSVGFKILWVVVITGLSGCVSSPTYYWQSDEPSIFDGLPDPLEGVDCSIYADPPSVPIWGETAEMMELSDQSMLEIAECYMTGKDNFAKDPEKAHMWIHFVAGARFYAPAQFRFNLWLQQEDIAWPTVRRPELELEGEVDRLRFARSFLHLSAHQGDIMAVKAIVELLKTNIDFSLRRLADYYWRKRLWDLGYAFDYGYILEAKERLSETEIQDIDNWPTGEFVLPPALPPNESQLEPGWFTAPLIPE